MISKFPHPPGPQRHRMSGRRCSRPHPSLCGCLLTDFFCPLVSPFVGSHCPSSPSKCSLQLPLNYCLRNYASMFSLAASMLREAGLCLVHMESLHVKPRCSERYIRTPRGLAHRHKQTIRRYCFFVTAWVDSEAITLSEMSWSENDKYHVTNTNILLFIIIIYISPQKLTSSCGSCSVSKSSLQNTC